MRIVLTGCRTVDQLQDNRELRGCRMANRISRHPRPEPWMVNRTTRGFGERKDQATMDLITNVALNLKPEDLQPWAEELRQQRVQDFRKDSPLARCLPVSVPFLNFRGLSEIVQTPGLIVVLHESE